MAGIVAMVACGALALGCSSEESSDSPTTVAPGATSTAQPAGSLDTTAPGTGPASVDANVELLAAALVSSNDVGVPDSWAIRDLDPDVPAAQLTVADAELAFGVVPCELGPPVGEEQPPWLRRRFAAPAEPLDNGLLAVEIVAEVHDSEAFADRAAALMACTGDELVGIESERRSATTTEGRPIEPVVLTVSAAPSAAVAFPSRHAVAVAHGDERTVTVVLSGIDQGQQWDADAVELAGRILDLIAP